MNTADLKLKIVFKKFSRQSELMKNISGKSSGARRLPVSSGTGVNGKTDVSSPRFWKRTEPPVLRSGSLRLRRRKQWSPPPHQKSMKKKQQQKVAPRHYKKRTVMKRKLVKSQGISMVKKKSTKAKRSYTKRNNTIKSAVEKAVERSPRSACNSEESDLRKTCIRGAEVTRKPINATIKSHQFLHPSDGQEFARPSSDTPKHVRLQCSSSPSISDLPHDIDTESLFSRSADDRVSYFSVDSRSSHETFSNFVNLSGQRGSIMQKQTDPACEYMAQAGLNQYRCTLCGLVIEPGEVLSVTSHLRQYHSDALKESGVFVRDGTALLKVQTKDKFDGEALSAEKHREYNGHSRDIVEFASAGETEVSHGSDTVPVKTESNSDFTNNSYRSVAEAVSLAAVSATPSLPRAGDSQLLRQNEVTDIGLQALIGGMRKKLAWTNQQLELATNPDQILALMNVISSGVEFLKQMERA